MSSDIVYLDTSALAKWYLNEPGSDAFVAYLKAVDVGIISSVTRVEMRSLLERRRRMAELDPALEARLFAAFLRDFANGDLSLYPVDDARYEVALQLIGTYPHHPLRTLDALHLGVAQHLGAACLATADAVMADAARALGFDVKRF